MKLDIHYLLLLSGIGLSGHFPKLLFLCATPKILYLLNNTRMSTFFNFFWGGHSSLKMTQKYPDHLSLGVVLLRCSPEWQLMSSSTEAEWQATVGLSSSWAKHRRASTKRQYLVRARGLSSRQWMGTNLCTCVGSVLFVTTSVGGVPSNAPTFTLTYTARLIHALQVCIVIPQAASFKANRLRCS